MSDYETSQKKRNIIVGLFVLVGVCALVWLMYKFQDLPIVFGRISNYQVLIQFPSAPGLQEKTPVRFCGFQVGKVIAVRPPQVLKNITTGQFMYQSIVAVNIEDTYNNIPADIEPKLITRGFGSSYIELRAKVVEPNAPEGNYLVNGSVLQGSMGAASEFFPEETQRKLEELVDKFKTLLENVNDVIGSKEAKENLKATMANLADATKQASQSLKAFQQLSVRGDKTLADTEIEVQRVSDAIVNVTDEFGKTSAELRAILLKINKGQGTAGKLVNDGRLYEGLLENSRQLDMLIEELKEFVAQLPEKGVPIKLK